MYVHIHTYCICLQSYVYMHIWLVHDTRYTHTQLSTHKRTLHTSAQPHTKVKSPSTPTVAAPALYT